METENFHFKVEKIKNMFIFLTKITKKTIQGWKTTKKLLKKWRLDDFLSGNKTSDADHNIENFFFSPKIERACDHKTKKQMTQ